MLDCGGVPVTALSTPGHSRDMMTYLFDIAGQKLAFCGDTVFLGGRILIYDDVRLPPTSTKPACGASRIPIDGSFPAITPGASVAAGIRSKNPSFLDRLLLPPNIL